MATEDVKAEKPIEVMAHVSVFGTAMVKLILAPDGDGIQALLEEEALKMMPSVMLINIPGGLDDHGFQALSKVAIEMAARKIADRCTQEVEKLGGEHMGTSTEVVFHMPLNPEKN